MRCRSQSSTAPPTSTSQVPACLPEQHWRRCCTAPGCAFWVSQDRAATSSASKILKRLLVCLSPDLHGHGSHTAGTVGAVGNNSVGVTGVAWTVGLLICKAAADGSFYSAALLDCYSLCEQVQCSMRAPASAAVAAAFEKFMGMPPWPGLAWPGLGWAGLSMPAHTSPRNKPCACLAAGGRARGVSELWRLLL